MKFKSEPFTFNTESKNSIGFWQKNQVLLRRQSDYVVSDRHYLSCLNWIERLNYISCGYFNAIMTFN